MNTSKEVILDAANSMVQQLRNELDALTKERDELRDTAKTRLNLLRKCEWSGYSGEVIYCPVCRRTPLRGHTPSCPLAVELEEWK